MGESLKQCWVVWRVIGLLVLSAGIAACAPEGEPTRVSTPQAAPTRTALAVSTLPPNTPAIPTRTRAALTQAVPITPTPACSGAPPARLILNERGRVADNDPRPLNVRSGPGTDFRIFGRLEVGDVFQVLDGPLCGDGYTWFKVRRGVLEGWIAEGDLGTYYAEPFLPG